MKVKTHHHDAIARAAAIEAGEEICTLCGNDLAVEQGLCVACEMDAHGQFGVGA